MSRGDITGAIIAVVVIFVTIVLVVYNPAHGASCG